MLVDPLGRDPIVITGSANFSTASTADNDENMLAIRGSFRAADIYFTEFNRLFNHYYFRSVTEARHGDHDDDTASLFLDETDAWQQKYAPGKLKRKRLYNFANLFVPLSP
jgi:phosphatidylserine/phosphatidylglycerophosphate/cardiolipin synthase-like enzyme